MKIAIPNKIPADMVTFRTPNFLTNAPTKIVDNDKESAPIEKINETEPK